MGEMNIGKKRTLFFSPFLSLPFEGYFSHPALEFSSFCLKKKAQQFIPIPQQGAANIS